MKGVMLQVERVGRYEIKGIIGYGTTGVVYLARDTLIARPVALKILRCDLEPDPGGETWQRFLREAHAAGRLSHPNIVTVFDAGEVRGQGLAFIAMEHVEGKTLQELIAGGPRLSFAQIGELVTSLALALHYAHAQGVIHRDVKPANIMISSNGQAKLTDFGIARLELSELTTHGTVIGSPTYMSPEQIRGEPVDGRSDLYSLGVILFELVTGGHPFRGTSLPEISHSIINLPAPDPATLQPEIPQALSSIILRCLAKEPEERFQTGADLATQLQELHPAADGARKLEVTDLHGERNQASAPMTMARLELQEGRVVHIRRRTELVIGRGDRCDIFLDHLCVSRKHGILSLSHDAARYLDLASTNGSTRNGKRVEGSIILNHGDVLGLGDELELAVRIRDHDDIVETLLVVAGCEEFLLTHGQVLIGSDPDRADIVLADSEVAGVHAQIELIFDAAIISSTGYGSAFLLDNRLVQSAHLPESCTLQLGGTTMLWRTSDSRSE